MTGVEAVALIEFAGTNVGEVLKQGILEDASRWSPRTQAARRCRARRTATSSHPRRLRRRGRAHGRSPRHRRRRKIAVFHQNDGFEEAGRKGVEEALAKRDLKLAAVATYRRNTDDVKAAIETIRKADVGAVIMVSVKPIGIFHEGLSRSRRRRAAAQHLGHRRRPTRQAVESLGDVPSWACPIMPLPYSDTLPITRSSSAYSQNTAGPTRRSPANFEEFMEAKVLIKALRAPAPTEFGKVLRALEDDQQLRCRRLHGQLFRQQPGQFALCRSDDRHRTQRHTAALIVFIS
ncbi:MAG: hypothetical protein U1E85_08715 [Rhodocyclaceae bacterium]